MWRPRFFLEDGASSISAASPTTDGAVPHLLSRYGNSSGGYESYNCQHSSTSAPRLSGKMARRPLRHLTATGAKPTSFAASSTSTGAVVNPEGQISAPTPVTPSIGQKPPAAPKMDFFGTGMGAPVLPQTFSTQPLPGQGSMQKLEQQRKMVKQLERDRDELYKNLAIAGIFGYAAGVHLAIRRGLAMLRNTARGAVETLSKVREISSDLGKKLTKKERRKRKGSGKKGKKGKGKDGKKKSKNKKGRRGGENDYSTDYSGVDGMDMGDEGLDSMLADADREGQLQRFREIDALGDAVLGANAAAADDEDSGPGPTQEELDALEERSPRRGAKSPSGGKKAKKKKGKGKK
mmetsp:Transcript_4372/g.10696  ORF Transcript_4372/g.10696 Transcript_4372/m.10696 type:complete len:349 (+) Transcript_4372:385-1431(+)